MGANDTMATMDYEYDTGRPFSPKNNETTVKVESITDNPDGSANIVFVMSAEARDAFTRIGIMKALTDKLNEAKQYDTSTEQPTVSECGWADETIKCQRCNCWKNS